VTSRKAILGSEIYTPEQIIPHGYLLIEKDRLVAIGHEAKNLPPDCEVFDVADHRVTPGLIDLHLHGAMGHNAMGLGLANVAQEMVKHGITSFLPTTLTAARPVVHSALRTMAQIIHQISQGARPLGIHLEGPHLSPQKAGMANLRHFHPFSVEAWNDLQDAAQGTIKMVTFAPEENEAMRLIPRLLRDSVVPSIGHSAATFDQVTRMVELGLAHASHMFNAMEPFHHRAPGVVGAVLYHHPIVAQLIADLHHVHPVAMELLFRLKGVDHVALVSDAAPVAGLPPGKYDWDAETRVIVDDHGACRRPDGTLAGATSFLNQNVSHLVEAVGLSWPQALQTATAVPGSVLDIKRGRLHPGWIADLVVWDEDFHPLATMVEGRWVWQQSNSLLNKEQEGSS
jgi:N-acetylglucosamine-6-phosphate deacetylase